MKSEKKKALQKAVKEFEDDQEALLEEIYWIEEEVMGYNDGWAKAHRELEKNS